MKALLEYDRNMRAIGDNLRGHKTVFDGVPDVGGEDTAPTPMEIVLQSLAACTFMDVVSILRKKRKTISALRVEIDGERANEHPKVFTKAHLHFILTSPDAELKDLERAIELSHEKYCSVSTMFKRSGCEVGWSAEVIS